MTLQISTLRPGLLVSLKSNLTGNVKYQRRDIVADHITQDGTKEAQWDTKRTINDPDEYERAIKARGAARSVITAVCAQSDFGLLCPEAKKADLDSAIKEARAIADAFNETATLTRVGVYCLTAQIAQDDVEAVRAINSEVTRLLDRMEAGCKNLDPEAIRAAANQARNLGTMLSDDAAKRVASAIEAARSAARKIVKAGETASLAIDNFTLDTITRARTAFLDLDEAKPIEAPTETGRALDFAPAPEIKAAPAFTQPQLEF